MLNEVTLIGHLGVNPELSYTATGTAHCYFSLATSVRWTDREGHAQERTEWHRIKVFGKLAEVCSAYLSKGKKVYIKGEIRYGQYENKEGQLVNYTDIIASSVLFLESMQVLHNEATYEEPQQQKQAPPQRQQYQLRQRPAPKQAPLADHEIVTNSNFSTDDIPF